MNKRTKTTIKEINKRWHKTLLWLQTISIMYLHLSVGPIINMFSGITNGGSGVGFISSEEELVEAHT